MTADLVAFLRARLDDDEQAARAAMGINLMAAWRRGKPVARWEYRPDSGAIWDGPTGEVQRALRVRFTWAAEAQHIVRHDPVRVLAEVDAKRRMLTAITTDVQGMAELIVSEWGEGGYESVPGKLLCLLALPYAAHPDYRLEWAPDA